MLELRDTASDNQNTPSQQKHSAALSLILFLRNLPEKLTLWIEMIFIFTIVDMRDTINIALSGPNFQLRSAAD